MIFDEFFKQRKRYFSKRPKDIDMQFKEALKSIKNELDGHLEALNENTSEIQTSYGCMNEINDKLEKLAERVESIEIFLQQHSHFSSTEKSFDIKPLTKTEQHVFLVIYALEDEKGLVSCTDISRKTALPNYVVSEYLARLVEKGIPLMKKYVNNIAYIRLNPEFKRIQAKENILCIDTAQKELINF
jgi:Fic family protein|tara:strand:+ start:195 stop:755 length:561 start_codon:yes stop_codon:yes gene_type:complete